MGNEKLVQNFSGTKLNDVHTRVWTKDKVFEVSWEEA
jgi:hypothetical protein